MNLNDAVSWDDLRTLADYPAGEWVYFTNEQGDPLDFVDGDKGLSVARFMGLIESAVGPRGVMGPLYHRLTDKGRTTLTNQAGQQQP